MVYGVYCEMSSMGSCVMHLLSGDRDVLGGYGNFSRWDLARGSGSPDVASYRVSYLCSPPASCLLPPLLPSLLLVHHKVKNVLHHKHYDSLKYMGPSKHELNPPEIMSQNKTFFPRVVCMCLVFWISADAVIGNDRAEGRTQWQECLLYKHEGEFES